MRIGYRTDPGKERDRNEDSLYVDQDLRLFIVADGMGGHNAGEVASQMAVEITAREVLEGLKGGKGPAQAVREAIAHANRSIFEKSLNNPAWEEMGTTLLTALATDHGIIIAHVGDSRAYFVQPDRIRQLTEDHTFVAEWLRDGLITKEDARTHEQRHGLTEAVGVTNEVEPEVAHWPTEDQGCLLLCSDGLTDMLEDEEILATLKASIDPQNACDNLVEAANRAGGRDNITVILVCPDHF